MSVLNRVAWAGERVLRAAASAGATVARATRSIPSSIRFKQLETWDFSSWDAAAISSALEGHERGDFSESAKLAEAFGRDERISACRNTRIRALIGRGGANFQMVASEEGDQRRAGTVRDQQEKLWFKVCNEEVLSRIQRDVIDLGVSVSRIHWAFDWELNQWIPRLEPWAMQFVRWDSQKECYVAQTAEHGEVECRPGTGEWLVVEPGGSRGYLAGGVRALAMPYFFRSSTWKDWSRYCEKHGIPILAIEEPSAQTDPAGKVTKDRFYAALRKLGREGVLRLPRSPDGKKGYGASYLEPKALSWPAFAKFLERLDICIAVYLLGQNLSTEVSGGSFAAAISQNRVRLDYLSADAECLSTSLRDQVLKFWGRFNFDWWNDALAAWPKWTTTVPEDLKAKAETMGFVGTALTALKLAGMAVDVKAVAEQYDIPLLSDADAEKAAKEAAAKKAANPSTGDKDDEDQPDPKKAEALQAGLNLVRAQVDALTATARQGRQEAERAVQRVTELVEDVTDRVATVEAAIDDATEEPDHDE